MEGRVLTEALTQPRQGDQKARVAEVRQIWPLVNALVAQSNYEDAG
jgi:hypothetical protein